jgi:ketosteroid isomerase-like protein
VSSEDNVARLTTAWRAFMDEDLAPMLSLLDPDVTYEDEVLPDHAGETYRGHEGIMRAWARFTEPWDSFVNELEWATTEGDTVVSCHHARMRGTGSGVASETRYGYVWRFHTGRVMYIRSYADPSSALEAAGLSAETPAAPEQD